MHVFAAEDGHILIAKNGWRAQEDLNPQPTDP